MRNLHTTHTFLFQNKFYEQVEGAPMWSLVCPIVASSYMEHFKGETIWSAPTPFRHWFRYTDDTFVIQQKANKQVFLDHINNTDPAIQFTVEGNQENGLFLSWIPCSNPRQTIPFPLQFTTNPPILTSTYSGIVITICLLNTVSLVPLPIGQKQCAPHHSFLMRSWNTSGRL